MMRRAAIVALGVSVLLHGALFWGGEFAFAPAVAPELPEPFMQAALIEPPPQVAPPPPAATPRPVETKAVPKSPPAPQRKVEARVTEPVAMVAPQATQTDALSDVADSLPAAAPEPAAAPALTPVAESAMPDGLDLTGWPDQGSIVFRVFMGDKGFEVGQSQHRWSHDDTRYRMETVVQTTGLVGLMRSLHYVQRSEGELGPRGLKPLHFTAEQSGKKPESAEFDWSSGRVIIRRDGRERRSADIRAGDQDVLSLWHQIGIVGAAGLPSSMTVVSNKGAKPATLEVVGRESARLPIGRLDTLRLRVQAADGTLTIDIWLAANYGMLPVRIRVADDQGEALDQQAIQLRLTPPGEEAASAESVAAAGSAAGMIELKEEPQPVHGLQEDIYRN
ncbi:MAG: DUF3108 domain-containing protein [Thauera sp.]|nr:DUF3108 domain-containing protein [Thauera sp.]